jgi:phasin family protein
MQHKNNQPGKHPNQPRFSPGLPIGETQMANKPKAAIAAWTPAPIAALEEIVATETAAAEAVVDELAAAPVELPTAAPIALIAAPIAAIPAVAATALPVKQQMEKVVKTAEEFVAFGHGNVEAIVKSSQIWAAGVQDLSKQLAANAQAQFDETMSVFKTMTSLKSLKDIFELQSTYAKAALEKTVSESGKLTDASLKLTEQALAPIAARVTSAVETFGRTA